MVLPGGSLFAVQSENGEPIQLADVTALIKFECSHIDGQ